MGRRRHRPEPLDFLALKGEDPEAQNEVYAEAVMAFREECLAHDVSFKHAMAEAMAVRALAWKHEIPLVRVVTFVTRKRK